MRKNLFFANMLLACILLLPSCSPAAPSHAYHVPPELDDGWETASPEEVGMDPEKMAALVQDVRNGGYDSLHSVLVVKDGKLVGGVAGLASTGETPVFLALAVGVSIFLLVLVAPSEFLGGLREVFLSSTWTLTYRELRSVEASEKEAHRMLELNTSGLEVASVA